VTRISRRGLVRGAALAGSLALLATEGPDGARAVTTGTAAAASPAGHGSPVASRSSVPSQSPPATAAHSTGTVRVQSRPIYTLPEYQAVVGGPAFPAHAVALTLDDGPHPVWTPKVLSLLDRYHVPATFCLIGNQVLGHEGVARSVVAAGHKVANHSYSHPTALPTEPAQRMGTEIGWAQDKIHSATGFTPRLFRSPGGGWSPALLAKTAQAGLIPIDWSDDPRDWARPGVEAIVSRLLAARPGQILLCHDGGGDRSQTYAALQTVIPALQAKGYTFVSL
jgi:peptidoglycan/xylan/chitin deacetylase (PgdA/CDA1 family)